MSATRSYNYWLLSGNILGIPVHELYTTARRARIRLDDIAAAANDLAEGDPEQRKRDFTRYGIGGPDDLPELIDALTGRTLVTTEIQAAATSPTEYPPSQPVIIPAMLVAAAFYIITLIPFPALAAGASAAVPIKGKIIQCGHREDLATACLREKMCCAATTATLADTEPAAGTDTGAAMPAGYETAWTTYEIITGPSGQSQARQVLNYE